MTANKKEGQQMTTRMNGSSLQRQFKTPEETEAEARKWAELNPSNADDAIEYLRRIVAETPIHSALLGEIGELFQIPKPVSAFFRAFCDDIQFLSPTLSPNGSPAVCLRSKRHDENYWAGFKRRGLSPISEHSDINPWAMLGIDGATSPFTEARVQIFEAFLIANYGAGNLRDMAGVCTDFKRQTGITFSSFFNGLRPAELQGHPLAAQRLNWAWSTSTPPCLSCAAKIRVAPPEGDVVAVNDNLVAEILPLASGRIPDYINYDFIAQRNGTNVQSAMVSYLAAFKQVFQARLLREQEEKSNPTMADANLQRVYRQAKFAAEQAKLALDAANSVIKAIEKIAPSVAK